VVVIGARASAVMPDHLCGWVRFSVNGFSD
jgi:hypothetical protein